VPSETPWVLQHKNKVYEISGKAFALELLLADPLARRKNRQNKNAASNAQALNAGKDANTTV
jgi:hypothetical protein